MSRQGVKHADRLTKEQCKAVGEWVTAAINAKMWTAAHVARRTDYSESTVTSWMGGRTIPSQKAMTWLSDMTKHPLPREIFELGPTISKMGEGGKKKYNAFYRNRDVELSFEPEELTTELEEVHIELRPEPNEIHRPCLDFTVTEVIPQQRTRADWVEQAFEALVALSQPPAIDFDLVLDWLRNSAVSSDQRMVLANVLWTRDASR